MLANSFAFGKHIWRVEFSYKCGIQRRRKVNFYVHLNFGSFNIQCGYSRNNKCFKPLSNSYVCVCVCCRSFGLFADKLVWHLFVSRVVTKSQMWNLFKFLLCFHFCHVIIYALRHLSLVALHRHRRRYHIKDSRVFMIITISRGFDLMRQTFDGFETNRMSFALLCYMYINLLIKKPNDCLETAENRFKQ